MRMEFKLILTVLTLLHCSGIASPAKAVDLEKVDRTISKEPKYTSQPLYSLLVFGKKAEKRVWLVVDDKVLYVDRNGNGDLTEQGERIELDAEASRKPNRDKGSRIMRTDEFPEFELDGVKLKFHLWVRNPDFVPPKDYPEVLVKHRANIEKYGWENATIWRVAKDSTEAQNPVLLCKNPQDAQITHFNGPLTFALRAGDGERYALIKGEKGTSLGVYIGTPGLATKNYSRERVSPLTTTEVPSVFHPIARFEFPHKEKGKLPILIEQKLSERCCGDNFYATVKVPEEAGEGNARVEVSIADWREGNVAMATFEVPISNSKSSD